MKGTIKSKDDMERLFREGRRSSSSLFSILVCPSPTQYEETGRCAFVAGKKLGVAPYRNRCKRVMRACAAELGAPWTGKDVVFIARRNVGKACHDDLMANMRRLLSKEGVISG